MSNLTPAEFLSYHRSFASAGSLWLNWLRDAPSSALPSSETCELFSWYCDQLGPFIENLEDSTQPPPALLLLLRFIRARISSLEIIELYSKDGLAALSNLVDIVAERLMLPGISFENSATRILVDMMAEAVAILDVFINALIDEIGEDFRDRTPVVPVCKAYAAASSIMNEKLKEKVSKILCSQTGIE